MSGWVGGCVVSGWVGYEWVGVVSGWVVGGWVGVL